MKHALHFPRIGKTLLAAALVAMAGTAAADQSLLGKLGSIFGASSETKAAASKGIEGDIDAAKALAFLYGNVQTTQGEEKNFGMPLSKEWALWKKPQCSNVKYGSLAHGEESCPQETRVHAVFDAKYTEQGKEKYILLTKTGDAPQMQNPDIFGAAVFAKENGQWALEVENRYIGSSQYMAPEEKYLSPNAGEFGRDFGFLCLLEFTTESGLVRVGPDKHGILLSAHGMNSGNGGTDCLVVVMPYGDSIGSFLLDVIDYWNEPSGGDGGWDMRPSFDEKSSGEYYDVVVRYQARKQKNKVKTGSTKMQFRNGGYYEVATPKAGKKGAKQRK